MLNQPEGRLFGTMFVSKVNGMHFWIHFNMTALLGFGNHT